MTTINTIENLARILREEPTWAEARRALLLTKEALSARPQTFRIGDGWSVYNLARM